MAQKQKTDLSTLPLNFVKVSKFFYKDSKSGLFIHVDKIHSFLPKKEEERKEYWWNKI